MFLKRIYGLLIPIFLVPSAISCSVKESRMSCPCYVNMNVDAFCALNGADDAMVSVISGSPTQKENITLSEYQGTGYDIVVDRKTNCFSCVVGSEGMKNSGDSIICPENGEWSRVYADSKSILCDADDRYVEMVPHKEFCTITFVLVGLAAPDGYPYDIRVRAGSNGMRVKDRCPVEGNYTAFAVKSVSGTTYSVRVPRQKDSEMVMDLLNHSEDRVYTVEDRVKTFPLGLTMKNMGYNWEKEDLEDIYVTVDYVRASVSVRLDEWSEEYYDEGI